MRKPGIFPPAELCCSVVAARRPTDLPTLFLKVGIAVSLRVFYTTGFIFQSYEIKCNYRHFRPDLWLFADVILWVKGKFAAACRGGSYFGETGSFVADGLKNPGFSEAEDMVGESTASGVVQCPGATGLEKCMRAGVGDGFVRSDNKRKATEFAGLYGIGNIESSVSFRKFVIREEMKKSRRVMPGPVFRALPSVAEKPCPFRSGSIPPCRSATPWRGCVLR